MTTHELGFGIIGAGMIARYHATGIAETPGARLAALCASGAARAAQAEAEFGVPCVASLDALLARPDVDVVSICTPSGLHAAQAIAAARAGKHVLVEKPIALTLAEADAMIAACDAAGVRLGVALQRRTDPGFRAVHAAVAAGALGRPVLGTVNIPYLRTAAYYASADWRGTWALDGGGALMNQGIHLVDLLLWFCGDVAEVQARADTLVHSIEVEDTLTATLRFTSGALGALVATTAAAPGYAHRIEVYGDRGGVQIEGESVVRWGIDGIAPPELASGPADAGAGAKPTGISTAGHTRIIADMVAAIRDGRAPLVTGAEARRSLALVLAAYESARAGGRSVAPA
jgi:predicted dehydrogenase